MKNKRNRGHLVVLTLAIVCSAIVIYLHLASTTSASAKPLTPVAITQSLNTWNSNGPDGGSVLALAIDRNDPTTLYAGTPAGVFKSTNGGASWSSSLANVNAQMLATAPTTPATVYAAGDGIYKSIDGGASWNLVSNGLKDQYGHFYATALTIDPTNANIIYTAGPDIDTGGTYKAIYRSTDGGGSWSIIKHSINPYAVHHALVVDPTNPNTIYAAGAIGASGTFWRSTNNGGYWDIFYLGYDSSYIVQALVIDPNNTNTIYGGTESHGVFKSTDGGATWSAFSDGLPSYHVDDNGQRSFHRVKSIVIDPVNPSILYAGTYHGVSKSSNGGSWIELLSGINLGVNAVAIDSANTNIMYAGTDGGVVKSSGGGSWSGANSGLHGIRVESLALNTGNADVYAGTSGGTFRTNDNGGNWSARDFYPLAFDPSDENTMYARRDGYDGLFKSLDGGLSWSAVAAGAPNSYASFVLRDPNNSNVIYAGTDAFYKSTDGGENWKRASNDLDFYPYLLVIDASNSQVMYATAYDGLCDDNSLFKSTDGGLHWHTIDSTLSFCGARSLVFDSNNHATIYVSSYYGIFKSTDSGDHWSRINSGLPDACSSYICAVSSLAVHPIQPNTLYAGTYGNGVFKSEDGGANWSSFNNGLSNLGVNTLGIDSLGNFLHAGTAAGVFDVQLSAATSTPTPTPSPSPTATPIATPTPTATPTPATGPSWTITGNLNAGRDSQTATLLSNGKVLVAGGNNSSGTLKSAELYDPANGTWSNTGNLNTSRAFHTATLLNNGKVLVAGGFSCAPPPATCSQLNSSELYDPGTGTWSNTGNLNIARDSHTATLLQNGNVLVAGGQSTNVSAALNSAELYDPVSGTWSITGNLINPGNINAGRSFHTATLLLNGKVLVAGGIWCGGEFCETATGAAELYDPTAGTWSNTGGLHPRALHTATLLLNGKVLVAGGTADVGDDILNTAEVYDPATGTWSSIGNLDQSRVYHTATLLMGGKVLVAGGFNITGGFPNITNSAELYDSVTGTWSNTASLNIGRRFHTATLLQNGKVLAAGGSGFNASNTAELYDTGANPIDDAQFFVRQQYLNFLNREPDQGGWDYWTSQITSCPPGDQLCVNARRVAVADAFFFEPEFQQTASYVFRIYRLAFGDNQPFPNPDADSRVPGFNLKIPKYSKFIADRAQVVGGANLPQGQLDFANAFVQRSEFLAKYPAGLSPTDFINAVLATITGANPSVNLSSQQSTLLDLYNQGGRGAVIYRLADDNLQTNPINNRPFIDAEYNLTFVANEYFGYLGRDGDTFGMNFWLTQINSAPLRDVSKQHAMVCSFITSTEYQQRFGSTATRSNADCVQ